MKIESHPINTTSRKVVHYAETTTPGHFIRVSTYHHNGRYVRTVNMVERDEHFERYSMMLGVDDGKATCRTIEATPRYSAKRLIELSGIDEDEVRRVAAANGLVCVGDAQSALATMAA